MEICSNCVLTPLVLLNGIFAMSELAIVSARRGRLMAMERRGSPVPAPPSPWPRIHSASCRRCRWASAWSASSAGVFGGAQLAGPWGNARRPSALSPPSTEAGFVLVVVAIAYANLILGELVPKQLALRDPERFAVAVARPMAWLARYTAPVVWVLSLLLARAADLRRAMPQDQSVTEEEVKAVVAEGAQAGALEHEERYMIERVLRLADSRCAR